MCCLCPSGAFVSIAVMPRELALERPIGGNVFLAMHFLVPGCLRISLTSFLARPCCCTWKVDCMAVAAVHHVDLCAADSCCMQYTCRYLPFSLVMYFELISCYAGGSEQLVQRLINEQMPLRGPPICCVLWCCPTPSFSK